MGLYLSNSSLVKSPNAIEVYKGQTKNIDLDLTKDLQDENGNVVYDGNGNAVETVEDLTGATIYFTVRTAPGNPAYILYKTSSDSSQIQILLPTTDGKAKIFLLPEDTMYLPAKKYYFDVWVKLVSGARYPVIEVSEFIVKESVTSFV